VVYLIAAREPRLVAEGRLIIPADEGNLAIDYPEADFDAGIEERPVDDPRLAATWGPTVYRITLAARHPGRQGTLQLEIGQLEIGQLEIGQLEIGAAGGPSRVS
jgi:hypothetical protein